MAKSQDCTFLPPPRILTRGRFLVLILGLLALTAISMADVSFDGVNLTGNGTYSSNISASGDLISTATDKDSTITLSNNTITVSGGYYHDLGNIVFENGTSTTITNGWRIRGDNTSTPAVTIDGTFICGYILNIGMRTGSGGATKGVLYITNNANIISKGYSAIGNSPDGQGDVYQSGGSITFTNEEQTQTDGTILRIGAWEKSTGSYNLSGGTLTCLNAGVLIGSSTNTTGTFNITGGTADVKGIKVSGNNGSKGTLNLYGGELKIAGSGVTKGNGTATINLGQGTVSALASHTWNSALAINLNGRAATSTADVAGGVTTFNADTDKTITLAGVVSGVGALTKTGAGTLTLSGANTFTGDVTISGGKLNASNAASLGSNSTGRTVTVGNGAELVFTVNNVITNAHNDQNVTYVLDGGRISNSGSVYNYLQNLTVKDGATIYAANGLSDWKAFKLHNVNVVRNSDDSAGAAVVFYASSNANATIAFGAKSGTIQAGTSVSTINVAEITSDNASVNDNVSDLVISAVIADPVYESNGALKNATKIVKTGAGTLELSGANTFTGPLVVEEGTLLVSNSAGLGANSAGKTITVGSGGEIVLAVNNVFSDAHNDQNVTYILDGGRISNLGAVYNYLQNLTLKDGASVYASDGHSPWNAYKFFNVSVERNSDGTAGAPVVFSADMEKEHATFAFGAKSSEAGTKTAVIYVEDITSSDSAVVDNVSDLVISGIIANTLINGDGTTAAAPIEKTGAGTLEFTAANTYTGLTTISAGTLKLTGDAIESVAGNITVNAGGTLEYNVAQNDERTATFTNAAYVLGNGDILKTGEGRLKINTDELDQAASDLHFTADNFVVASGRLDLEGYMLGNIEVDANTVFSPGNSIGEATFGGGYILKDGATLLLEVGKDGDDVLTDVLNVTGDTTFEDGSIIKIALDSSYDNAFEDGEQVDILLPTGIKGGDGNALNLDNLVFQSSMFDLVGYNAGTGYLSVVYSAPAAGVPEPSTWALLVLGVTGLLYVRKRKN